MKRKINKYPKERWSFNSKAEKWGVDKKRGRPYKRKLLILGTGRSGTTTISAIFKKWGYDLPHERTGEFGSATHFFHTDHYWYPMLPWNPGAAHVGERLSDYDFEHRLHVIRNPLTCIPSMAKVFVNIDWEFAEDTKIIPIEKMSKLKRCMLYWYNLNSKLEDECDHTIRLENLREELTEYLDSIDIQYGSWQELQRNRGTGYKKSNPLTWDQLNKEDYDLSKLLFTFAQRLGY